MAEWQPLVTDPARRAEVVDLIGQIVSAVPSQADELTLQADHAVMRGYLAQEDIVPDPDDEVTTSLAAAITTFAGDPVGPALFGGACRIGWTIEHLAGGETSEQVCGAIDRALLQAVESWSGDYDLIGGLVGFGVYGLERGEAGRPVVARVLELLERAATPRDGGLAWHTKPELLPAWQREVAPDGYWNLGLAHGMPGVAGLLARCVRHDVEAARARPLLDRLMTYLIAAAGPEGEGGRYPAWLPSEGGGRRVSWCYGDLGVTFGLLAAARACQRADWEAHALALGRSSAMAEDPAVRDGGLCHGTAGAMHLFLRLWNATGDAVFADAARRWLDRTFAVRRTDDYAGFPMLAPDHTGDRWLKDASILTGAPGVALALHAAISSVEPSWDRVLLVDV